MSYCYPLRILLLLAGLAAPLCGQIMHLHVEASVSFRGEYVTTYPFILPDSHAPATVDVYYDPALEPTDSWNDDWKPDDAANNFFRVQVNSIDVDVRGALTSILSWGNSLWFESENYPNAGNSFTLHLGWSPTLAIDGLPAGTFPEYDPEYSYQDGADPLIHAGPKVFKASGYDTRYNWGDLDIYSIDSVDSEVVPRMSMSPVPEPSTYAGAAVALLLAVVGLGRCRARRAISAA